MTNISKSLQIPDVFTYSPDHKNRVKFSLFLEDKGVRFYGKKVAVIKNFFTFFHIGKGAVLVYDLNNNPKYISIKSLDHLYLRHAADKTKLPSLKKFGLQFLLIDLFNSTVFKNPLCRESTLKNLEKSNTPNSIFLQASIYAHDNKDLAKAAEYYLQAAEKGHYKSLWLLVYTVNIHKLNETQLDSSRYAALCEKHAKTDPCFFVDIAKFYVRSNNYVEAKKWLEKGVAAGDITSKEFLGLILISKKSGLPPDNERAIELFKACASKKKKTTYYYLAVLYSLKKDGPAAIKWYKKAALQAKESKACCALGDIYRNGYFEEKVNIPLAKKWYKKAINLGSSNAKEKLALIE